MARLYVIPVARDADGKRRQFRRTGFETSLPLRTGHVVALDARGRALGSYRLP